MYHLIKQVIIGVGRPPKVRTSDVERVFETSPTDEQAIGVVSVPGTSVLVGVHETRQLVQHGRQKTRVFVPRTSVFVGILQTVEVSARRGVGARQLVPRTSVLSRVPETVQVAGAGRLGARPFVPRARVFVHVHQAVQVSAQGRHRGRRRVPGAADLVGQPQTVDVPVTGGRRAHGGRGKHATAPHHLPVHVPPVAVRVETASFGVRLQDFEQRRATQLQVDGR